MSDVGPESIPISVIKDIHAALAVEIDGMAEDASWAVDPSSGKVIPEVRENTDLYVGIAEHSGGIQGARYILDCLGQQIKQYHDEQSK